MFLFLGFAGKNRQGRKEELLARALDLVKLRSVPLQAKIREIYKASQEAQQQTTMMGQGGMPNNPYSGMKIFLLSIFIYLPQSLSLFWQACYFLCTKYFFVLLYPIIST